MRNLMIMLLLVLLGACAPGVSADVTAAGRAAGEGDKVVLINGPTEERLPGLADQLEAQLRKLPDCCAFAFQWSVPVRNQEGQRDLYGVRAPLQAAYLARNLGDRWPVLIGTTGFERLVTEHDSFYDIRGQLAVQALLVDIDTGQVLQVITTSTYQGSRQQDRRQALPSERQDPLMSELAQLALQELAPQLLQQLNALAAR